MEIGKNQKRIDFIKRLLEMNGFKKYGGFSLSQIKYKNGDYSICVLSGCCLFYIDDFYKFQLLHNEPLKPIREFIKLSNQK
jgi:hypothetical protein